jgi:hypothetical protein
MTDIVCVNYLIHRGKPVSLASSFLAAQSPAGKSVRTEGGDENTDVEMS